MPGPWSGELPRRDENTVTTTKNDTVSQVQAAVNKPHRFERADKLKQMIDDPMNFSVGREWSTAEKNELKQAEADYEAIQSGKKTIGTSLTKVDELLHEKSRQSQKLSQDVHSIESKINEIDKHLSEYKEKLKLLEEKDGDKTPEEIAWESEALEQIKKLESEKASLSSLLTTILSLQQELNNAEKTVTNSLEELLTQLSKGNSPKSDGPFGSPSANAINKDMAEIKDYVLTLSKLISAILEAATELFNNIFESIENISSTIGNQLKSTNAVLAESDALLSNYPSPKSQMEIQ